MFGLVFILGEVQGRSHWWDRHPWRDSQTTGPGHWWDTWESPTEGQPSHTLRTGNLLLELLLLQLCIPTSSRDLGVYISIALWIMWAWKSGFFSYQKRGKKGKTDTKNSFFCPLNGPKTHYIDQFPIQFHHFGFLNFRLGHRLWGVLDLCLLLIC